MIITREESSPPAGQVAAWRRGTTTLSVGFKNRRDWISLAVYTPLMEARRLALSVGRVSLQPRLDLVLYREGSVDRRVVSGRGEDKTNLWVARIY